MGDSKAVLATDIGEEIPKAVPLTKDHKPDDPEEMKRIIEWGGFVSPSPEPGISARVWLDKECTMIGLAMSRSIGWLISIMHSIFVYDSSYLYFFNRRLCCEKCRRHPST